MPACVSPSQQKGSGPFAPQGWGWGEKPVPLHLTCSSPPDWVDGHHACVDVRAATAAPWLVSVARLTGHAWPEAGGLLTWGVE